MPYLQDDIDNFISQLDGAPPHGSANARDYLEEYLPCQWIGRFVDYNMPLTQWPSRNPNLKLCKNAVQARKKLIYVYGKGVLTVRQCQNWFAKFRSGNFDVEDAPRSGRPVEADKDAIKALVDANRRITTSEIGLRLNLSNSTVYDHLKGLGLSLKLDIWVPHVLTERNLCRRIDVCDSLLKRHENDPLLIRSASSLGAKKLLPDNTTINSEVYCHQLDKLNDALQQKRSELINKKGVVFHQDNARPHTRALPFFALPLPSTQIGSLSKQILSSETKKSRTVPNLTSTARVRALERVYRPNTVSQIARYGQVPCPGAKSTSCSSTTRAISYKLVLAVLPKLTNSKSGLQSDPQEPIQSSRYR
ncbi:histone-lysine N-methyltransferase SETMAR [Trichonephila clavipes]|nr:histone-lysine N-methyltransferase SETMAR [Trichonephila clavipes]